jgi:hypothetical protein
MTDLGSVHMMISTGRCEHKLEIVRGLESKMKRDEQLANQAFLYMVVGWRLFGEDKVSSARGHGDLEVC